MRKTGLYIILGIIISLTVFVLAGILYFQPRGEQLAVSTQVSRPAAPAQATAVTTPAPAVSTEKVPAPSTQTPSSQQVTTPSKVPPPVKLSMKVTPYTPPAPAVSMDVSVTEAAPEVIETVPAAEVIETVPAAEVIETVPAAEVIETVPAAEVIETVPAAEVIETVPAAEVIETVPAAEVIETVPAAEVIETVPAAEVIETVPAAEVIETVPAAEVIETIPAAEVIETVPEADMVETVPTEVTEAVPAEAATDKGVAPVSDAVMAADVEGVTEKLVSEPTAPAPKPFTPSDATYWIVKNSMPIIFSPEVFFPPISYETGDPIYVTVPAFREEADQRRKEAVDSLFDSLQFN